MRIATWNVNSLKARLEKVVWWLERARPDVLLMQETKLADADAPARAFRDAGLRARAPRRGPLERRRHREPLRHRGRGHELRRAAAARADRRRRRRRAARRGAHDLGRRAAACASSASTRRTGASSARRSTRPSSPGSSASRAGSREARRPARAARARRRLQRRARRTPTCGTRAPATAARTSRRREREAFARLCRWGLVDAYRLHHPEPGRYTWWDYRAGQLPQELRHAHRPPAGDARRSPARTVWAEIDREARKGKPIPSDHAPLRHRPRRARARRSTPAGPRPRAHRGAPRGRALMATALTLPDRAAHRADAREARRPSCPRATAGSSSRSGTASAPSSSATATRVYIQSRDLQAARPLLPRARGRPARASLPDALRGRRRDRDRGRARARLRRAAAAPAPGGLARARSSRRRRRRRSWPSTCSPTATATCARARRPSAAPRSRRRCARVRRASTSRPARATARSPSEWFHRFEGAGLDGVIAKHESTTYQPGKRAMIKVKHARTADCVVAGFRWHKNGPGHAGRLAAARPLRRRRARSTTSA